MLEFCDNHSVLELYIEVKDGDKQQLEQTIDMVKSYNIDISWACTTYEQAQHIVNYDPYARISLMPYNINEELQNILSLKTGYNDVFIFAYGNAILNAADRIAKKMNADSICLKVKRDSFVYEWYKRHGYSDLCADDEDKEFMWMVKRFKGGSN